ncbi:hypothetical protein OG873_22465 [Streptomyces violaceus]|uniref:CocE/NonD family hydrolase n=1 Tax=Streptomyces violaceus TaxID=1936 RepID=UPI00324DDF92
MDARRRDRTRPHRRLVPPAGRRHPDASSQHRPRRAREWHHRARAGFRRPGERWLRGAVRRAVPAFARYDLPELGYERSRREPDWAGSCRVAGRHDEVDLPTFQVGGWYDIFSQGTLDNFTAMRRAGRPATLITGPWTHTNWRHSVSRAYREPPGPAVIRVCRRHRSSACATRGPAPWPPSRSGRRAPPRSQQSPPSTI